MAFRYTPTPTPSITPTISLTPSITPSYTPTGTVCPGATPTMTPSLSVSLTATHTPTPSTTPEYSAYCACYEIVITSPAPPEGYAGSIEYYTCGDKVLMGRIFATPGTYYQCGSNDIGFEPTITDGTGTITDLGYNCLGGCPVVEPTTTPTSTPTPTPTLDCRDCDTYANNTFETLEIDYQSCEGVWYYNELIPANQTICITRGTGGGTDWAEMDLQAPDCGPNPCPTPPPEYDLYEADRFTCLYPGCALDASGIIVALPAGTTPDYGKFYSSLIPDGFSYELIGLGSGGPGWILSTLNYTSCADACAPV